MSARDEIRQVLVAPLGDREGTVTADEILTALRARVAVLERITRMLAGFAEKAATLDWNEDNNVTWAAVVAAEARAALSAGSATPSGARGEP